METQSLVSYCPRKSKNVLLLSTLHGEASVSSRDDKKPQIILDYTKSKGGVDNKMVATCPAKRKTPRWPMVKHRCSAKPAPTLSAEVMLFTMHSCLQCAVN
ncbi:hypothetical protein R3I94_008798 [Phoxinus phoxinus]